MARVKVVLGAPDKDGRREVFSADPNSAREIRTGGKLTPEQAERQLQQIKEIHEKAGNRVEVHEQRR